MRKNMPSLEGDSWGVVVGRSDVKFPPKTAEVIGATLDFSVAALQAIEAQLLWHMTPAWDERVSILQYLYFALPETQSRLEAGQEVLARALEVFRTVREGFESAKGSLEIHQTDPSYGNTLSGYVIKSLFSGMGHIHLNFAKIMGPNLIMGAPFFANLLVHEATHKYCQTLDVEVKPPGGQKTTAYMGVCQDLWGTWDNGGQMSRDQLRKRIAGSAGAALTTKQAMNNADSFSWFMQGMLEGIPDTLNVALKFSGTKAALKRAARNFEDVQRDALGDAVQIAHFYRVA